MSLMRLVANVESKIVRELIVPELVRMVTVKLMVSLSFEKSSFVYSTNLIVFVGGCIGCEWLSFLHDITKHTVVKIDKTVRNTFIFLFYSKYGEVF